MSVRGFKSSSDHRESFVKWVRARLKRDDGAILVLAAFVMVLLFAMAALAVDISLKSGDRQYLWNTTDAAALAGSSQLPDGLAARTLAMKFALDNDPTLAGDIDITFRCLVADADGDGQPDAADVPGVCDPTPSLGAGSVSAPPFVCADFSCVSPCNPDLGDTCNTLVVETEKTTDYKFAPVIGINEGDSHVISAACRGSCGRGVSGPVDLVLIIDRTTSMSDSDLDNAKRASLAVLDFFNPNLHHVGLAALGSADASNLCNGLNNSGVWMITPLSSDYKDNPLPVVFDGETFSLDPTSDLVSKVICLNKQTGTNLGDPLAAARAHLATSGRPGVKQGIILLSDGSANQPDPNPCQWADTQATDAKSDGIEVFTIGFGIGSKTCDEDTGFWQDRRSRSCWPPWPQLPQTTASPAERTPMATTSSVSRPPETCRMCFSRPRPPSRVVPSSFPYLPAVEPRHPVSHELTSLAPKMGSGGSCGSIRQAPLLDNLDGKLAAF